MLLKQHVTVYLIAKFPEGNYSGSNLVSAVQDLLNALDGNFTFEVIYNPARGTVNNEEKPEGTHANNAFLVPSGFGIMNWMSITGPDYPWRNIGDTSKAVGINNVQSVKGVSRNTGDSSSPIVRLLRII